MKRRPICRFIFKNPQEIHDMKCKLVFKYGNVPQIKARGLSLLMHAMKPDTDSYEDIRRQPFIQRNPFLENGKH